MARPNAGRPALDTRAQLERLSVSIDRRDGYTAAHSRRVVAHAGAITRRLGLAPREALVVRQAALFHDIGKLTVPDWILLKPGALTQAEWRVMRSHSAKGATIVAELGFCEQTVKAVRHHHERFDGGGYPEGLAGEEIPLAARVVHVADAIDAMSSDRVYGRARSMAAALDEVRAESGRQFCPRCVRALDVELELAALAPRPVAAVAG
ncbi:MAG: HD-GYP domain-containing protein [Gaiellales bacterium]